MSLEELHAQETRLHAQLAQLEQELESDEHIDLLTTLMQLLETAMQFADDERPVAESLKLGDGLIARMLHILDAAEGTPYELNCKEKCAVLTWHAEFYRKFALLDKAEDVYERILTLEETALLPDSKDTSIDASHLATTFNNLAMVYRAKGRFVQAEMAYKRALAVEEGLAEDQRSRKFRLGRRTSQFNLALVYREDGTGRDEDAAALLAECIDAYAELAGTAGNDDELLESVPPLMSSLCQRGNILLEKGQLEEARELLERALQVAEQHPDFVTPGQRVTALSSLGSTLEQLNMFDEAEKRLEEASELQKTTGGDPEDLGLVANNLANVKQYLGKTEEAMDKFYEALQLFESVNSNYVRPFIGTICANLGSTYQQAGNLEEAERFYERGLSCFVPRLQYDAVPLLSKMGVLLKDMHKYEDARRHLEQCLEMEVSKHGDKHPAVARALSELGNVYLAEEKFDQAEPLLRKALAIRQAEHANVQPEHHEVGLAHWYLGEALVWDPSKVLEGERHLRDALRILDATLGPDHEHTRTLQQTVSNFQGLDSVQE